MSIGSVSSLLCLEIILEKISAIALQVQQGREVDSILQVATDTARGLLKTDRVVVYRFLADQDAVVAFESIGTEWTPILGRLIYDPCLDATWVARYQQGQITAISDIHNGAIAPCHAELLERLEVQANLVVPILYQGNLWGLLIAHHCCSPREWQILEIQLLQHIALQMGIALQQAELRQSQQSLEHQLGQYPAHWDKTTKALQANQDAAWDWDVITGEVWYSPRWKQMHGFADHEIGNCREEWSRRIHPEDIHRVMQAVQAHFDNPTSTFEQEYRVQHKDGSYRWVLDRGQAIRNQAGTIVRMAGTETDITAKKQTELALQRQAQREYALHEVAKAIHSSLNLDSIFATSAGCIAEFLDGEVAIVQYLPEQGCWRHRVVYNRGTQQIEKLNLDVPDADNPFAAQLKQLQVVQIDDTNTIDDPINHKLAESFPGAWLLMPISISGNIWGSLTLARLNQTTPWQPEDINLAKRVADQLAIAIQQAHLYQQLQSSEEKLKNVLENVNVAVTSLRMFSHCDWDYDYISSGCEALFGYLPEDLKLNKTLWLSQVFPEDQERVLQNIFDTVFSASTRHHEYRFCHSDGSLRWIAETLSSRWQASENCWLVTLVSMDVTDRKATEIALQESEERFRQMATSIHEVFWMASIDFTQLFYVSPVYEEIWGRSCASLYEQPKSFIDSIHPDDRAQALAVVEQQRHSGFNHEYRVIRPDGTIRWIWERAFPVEDAAGNPYQLVGVSQDITDRKIAEIALREQKQFTEQIAESTLAILYVYDLVEQRNIYSNRQIERGLGYPPAEIQTRGDTMFPMLLHPDDLPNVIANHQHLIKIQDDEFVETEYRMRHKSGDYRWLLSRDRIFSRTADGMPRQSLGVATDITLQKEAQATLHQQAERQRLLSEIAQHIRQSLDLEHILQTTVNEVRQFLHTDRVIIYQFNPDWSGTIIAESVANGWQSILGMQITDTYFVDTQGHLYQEGPIKATNDIYQANLNPCHVALLEQMQVRAKLVVPILQDNLLWGLLVAQHCQSPRQWEASEIELQRQLATQIGIAIQQSELYQQVQTLNTNLELQVQERTGQIQQALKFEALLKRITDQVRDTLDEQQILQKVVQELAIALGADCCDTTSYNADRTIATVKYEYTLDGCVAQSSICAVANSSDPNIYLQLFQGQLVHCCLIGRNVIRPDQSPKAILACPVADDQGVFGDLWIFKPAHESFNDLEMRLVQQVANQCAIALRQSRLYQASQKQVQELERLNQLKDDFLSTVSHELRSPMASIKMATQMLEISLTPLGVLDDPSASINRYFKILQDEGEREIHLINDLLDLARLDAGTEPLNPTPVTLQFYIPYLTETFVERTRLQQQQLITQIPDRLPDLITDLPFLERILTELLHNACKYTPAGETITVSAQAASDTLEIRISNSGVEISAAECDRIFDKFYRIPNNDPWKHGGTGLGLALVKKLTERLGAQIQVESGSGKTTFALKFGCPLRNGN